MMRISPMVRQVTEEKGNYVLNFYHCSKPALRIPLTFEQHQAYSKLKKNEKKDEAKPNSTQRLKEFFTNAKETESRVNEVILMPNKLNLQDIVYHYDSTYRVLSFFTSKNIITQLVYDKATIEKIVKENKAIKINDRIQTLTDIAKSDKTDEVIKYIANLPKSKHRKEMDLFLKILAANHIRQTLHDFERARIEEINRHKVLIDYQNLHKNFRLSYNKFENTLKVHDNITNKYISSISLSSEVYQQESPKFVMPENFQAILIKHCGEAAIKFLQSLLDYQSLHAEPAKPKHRSRKHHPQDYKVYNPYLSFTPPDFDNGMGGFRKSPHTPPEDTHSQSHKRKASQANLGHSNETIKPKRQKTMATLFPIKKEVVEIEESPEIPGNQLAAL